MRHAAVLLLIAAGTALSVPGAGGARPAGAACRSPTPIGGASLRDALRRHGFTAQCRSVAGVDVANAGPTDQGVTSRRARKEGTVLCAVYRRSVGRMARHPHTVYWYGTLPTKSQTGREVYVANVECSLYLDPGTRASAPRALRTAFAELARLKY